MEQTSAQINYVWIVLLLYNIIVFSFSASLKSSKEEKSQKNWAEQTSVVWSIGGSFNHFTINWYSSFVLILLSSETQRLFQTFNVFFRMASLCGQKTIDGISSMQLHKKVTFIPSGKIIITVEPISNPLKLRMF